MKVRLLNNSGNKNKFFSNVAEKFGKFNKIPISFTLPAIVFLVLLTISFQVWSYIEQTADNEKIDNFNFRVILANKLIENRVQNYADILKAGRGLFYSSADVSRDEFKTFIEALQIDKNYPGNQGVGFSEFIPQNKLANHIERIKKEGFPNYDVHPKGEREFYSSIIFIEPFKDRNLRAFGYDMYSELTRREAMQKACDMNQVVISGKVELIQETETAKQAGFIMFLPIYKNGTINNTVEQRRKNLLGWIYSPFRMNDLMTYIFGPETKDIDIEIFDGEKIDPEALMYDSDNEITCNEKNAFSSINKLFFGEHYWTVSITSILYHTPQSIWGGPKFIAFMFALCSVLMAFLTYLLVIGREKALEMNKTKDRFFSIISHDLRSPFNGFLNLSEIISQHPEQLTSEELKVLGSEIYKSAQNQFNLLTDLLNWAKIQMDKFDFKPGLLDLNNEVSSIFRFYEVQAKQKTISLINEVEENTQVYYDKNMLDLVLRNLISNSLKFTNANGYVKISSEKKGKFLIVFVMDNGVGIEPENLSRLFQNNARYTTLGTNEEKGTGLGLMLCKEIIEKHGGKISVESEFGKGSTFIFSLPVL